MPPADDEIATSGQRFANMLLDTLGFNVLAILIGVVAGIFGDPAVLEGINGYIAGFVLSAAYYGAFEGLTSRTPAKLVTGTKVVSERGGPPSSGQIIGRTLVRLVPFEIFSFLVGGDRPVGWHDRWSQTRVVRTRPSRAAS